MATRRYEVILAHEETGNLVTWAGEAADEHHACQEAQEAYGLQYFIESWNAAVRHPEVEVESRHLEWRPLAATGTALRVAGVPQDEIDEFRVEAMLAGDSVGDVIKKWVTIT